MSYSGTAPFVAGQAITVTVTYQNTGGAAANTVDGILNFNGYAGVTQSNPASVTVSGGQSGVTQVFTVTLATSVVSGTCRSTAR